jgi:hypothetical protein
MNKHQLIVNAFEASFADAIVKLATSEKVSKETLKTISREVLIVWHQTGHVQYANKLLAVLSPMNKKACVVFFKHFSGYSFDDVAGVFTKKSKKRYDKAHAECMEALDDPHFNVWTWAERHIEVTHKPFDVDSVTKYFTSTLKKALGAGVSQKDVLKAVFKAGVDPDVLIEAFEAMCTLDDAGHEWKAYDIQKENHNKKQTMIEAAPF